MLLVPTAPQMDEATSPEMQEGCKYSGLGGQECGITTPRKSYKHECTQLYGPGDAWKTVYVTSNQENKYWGSIPTGASSF